MRLSDYIKLYKVARNRLRSEDDYRSFQRFQAALIIEYMNRFLSIDGRVVLDLGAGLGGYSQEMAKRGAAKVICLDLVGKACPHELKVHPVVADALFIPLPDESVDLVFCASLIEHVSDPAALLIEIRRVLRRGEYCYLSFPPFYSPLGGHEFSPFHYFGEKISILIYRFLARRHPEWVIKIYNPEHRPTSFSKTFKKWGLFKLTISRAKQTILETKWEIVDISPRYLPFNTTKMGILSEFITWHVQFILKKPYR